jgi:hypothetical protein
MFQATEERPGAFGNGIVRIRGAERRLFAVRLGVAIAFIAVLGISGCGGSSKQTSKASPSLSFQVRVDRICTARDTSPRLSDLPSFAELATARAQTARELSALHPPSGLMNGYRRLVSLILRQAALLRRLGRYEREHNDAGAIATVRELHSNPLPKQARLLGLAKCA